MMCDSARTLKFFVLFTLSSALMKKKENVIHVAKIYFCILTCSVKHTDLPALHILGVLHLNLELCCYKVSLENTDMTAEPVYLES